MNEQTMNNFSSPALQKAATPESAEDIKQMTINYIKQIENLVEQGSLTYEQGQNLMNYVTQKAFENYNSRQTPQVENNQQPAIDKVPPEFFNKEGRLDVFDYIKSADVNFDEDELSKISSLVEKIENSAIDRYLKAKDHEKTLNSENETAKQRLRANAQNSVSDGSKNLVFTREQIGRMSGAEFAKHERAIMDQLKKGLIR